MATAIKGLPLSFSRTAPDTTARVLPLSPLSLDTLTRDLWGQYDTYAIAQLAPLAREDCYQPKLYKAPAQAQELFPAFGYAAYGLGITPGSIIYGFYVPTLFSTGQPQQFNLQIKDESLDRKFWDHPIPAIMIGSFKPCFLGQLSFYDGGQGYGASFPYLLPRPYPVVGKGTFYVQIWNPLSGQQRIELIIGVFENISRGQ